MPRVAIAMGSDSDLPVMAKAAKILEEFQVDYDISIVSAHRCPDEAAFFARSAEEKGISVIIAGAGLAAHLPGVLASYTTLPVIGIPLCTGISNGTDALYSIVQMPPGVPVATVGINNAQNGALLAIQILSMNDGELKEKLKQYKQKMRLSIVDKDVHLHTNGLESYLKEINK